MFLKPWPGPNFHWLSRFSSLGLLPQVERWCRTECRGKYTVSYYYDHSNNILFEDEQDAVAFAMTWSR